MENVTIGGNLFIFENQNQANEKNSIHHFFINNGYFDSFT